MGQTAKQKHDYPLKSLLVVEIPDLGKNILAMGIYLYQNEQQDRKTPQGGPSITEERKRNADHRHDPDSHRHIDQEMEKEYGKYTPSIIPGKISTLACRHPDDLDQEQSVQYHDDRRAGKAPLLSQGRKNKVRMLLGDEIPLSLGAHQETFPPHPAGAYGYFALVRIEPYSFVVLHQFEGSKDTLPLVILEHIVPYKKVECTVKPQNKHRSQQRTENAFPAV